MTTSSSPGFSKLMLTTMVAMLTSYMPYAHADDSEAIESDQAYFQWKKVPIEQRLPALVEYAKVNVNAKFKFKEAYPTEDNPYSYSTYYYKAGAQPARCEITLVYNKSNNYNSWTAELPIDSAADRNQIQLLVDGFTFAHEVGHCVHFNHNHAYKHTKLPTRLRKDATARYQEIYADLYALALLSKRMDFSLFSKVVLATYYLRAKDSFASSHDTADLLKDVDLQTYTNLRNAPLKQIPAITHKAALAYTNMAFGLDPFSK